MAGPCCLLVLCLPPPLTPCRLGGACRDQAKKFVEEMPQVLKAGVTKEEAEKIKEAIAAVGGTVEIA